MTIEEHHAINNVPSNEAVDSVARILAATTSAQSLAISLQRKYLDASSRRSPYFRLIESHASKGNLAICDPYWLKVDQVGAPASNDLASCLIAMERILHAAHRPFKQQLVCLVVGTGSAIEMYLGIRPDDPYYDEGFSEEIQVLSAFSRTCWPGLKLDPVDGDLEASHTLNALFKRNRRNILALTGLPSLKKELLTTYPATLDRMIGALPGRKWAYMVLAMPLPPTEVDSLLNVCRELAGSAEALRSFNFSETDQSQESTAFSKTRTLLENCTESASESRKGVAGTVALGGAILAGSLLADTIFPGTGELVRKLHTCAPYLLSALGGIASSALLPTTTQNRTINRGNNESEARTHTFSRGQSRTISQTLVNKHMDFVVRTLESHIERFERSQSVGSWDVSAYLIGEEDVDAASAGHVLRSLLSGDESVYEPIRVHEISEIGQHDLAKSLGRCCNPVIQIVEPNIEASVLPHPLGERYQHLSTVMNTKELAMLVNFPTRSVPGIDVVEVPDEGSLRVKPKSNDSVVLGKSLYAGTVTDIDLPLEKKQLAKHVLICGTTGSGKSNTCRRILQELLDHKEKKHDELVASPVPFLVIEPAKDEYVEWAMRVNDEAGERLINVFMPGRTMWNRRELEPFFLNPFDFVWLDKETEPRVLEHIDRLKTIVNAALPMQEVLPVLMEELLYRVYMHSPEVNAPVDVEATHNRCWLPKDSREYSLLDPKMERPNFDLLRSLIAPVVREKGYDRSSQDIKAALTTRIDGFLRGWRSSVLSKKEPAPAFWQTLFDQPTVVNLSALSSDDDKAFFMGILLQFLYEYRQAQHELNQTKRLATPDLKHLLVLEEAHRILCSGTYYGPGAANSMAKLGEMFSNMISEVRSYGQGILIADQVPGRLNPDAIKNTNLKIVHHLQAQDDREMMSVCLDLKPSHARLLGSLKAGEALVRGDLDNDAAWVKITRSKWDMETEEGNPNGF